MARNPLAALPDPASEPLSSAAWSARAGRSDVSRALAALDGVHGGARAVVDELDRGELAKALARALAVALHTERAVVAVVEEAALGAIGVQIAGRPSALPVDEATRRLLLRIAERRQGFVLNDPHAELPGGGPRLLDLGWRNALGMPAKNHQGRVIAVLLAVDRRGAAPFGPVEERAAETIALQAAVSFERALLLERLDDWSTGLEALLAFGAAVNKHLEPRALVRHLVEHAARFLKVGGGLAGLAAPAAPGAPDDLEMIAEGYWFAGRWHEQERRFRRRQGLAGFVLENEFPYLANDYPGDPLADRDLAFRYEVARAACIPIKSSDERILGFFELHRTASQPPFSWQDAAFLESLANTTAVAIENARLLSDLEAKGRQIRSLSAHNVRQLEAERRHISRELHDQAGQALVSVKLGLQVMARLVPGDQPALREQLDRLRDQVNAATLQIKDLAQRLRPPILDQLGLEVALAHLAQEYGVRAGFEAELDCAPLPGRPSHALETAIYRIAQEALANVATHAGAARVRIGLAAEGGMLRFAVEDDGRGFDVPAAADGLGLLGMRERIGMLGGTLALVSAAGKGTTVEVAVPWEGEGE
ncbi:MAG TPA: GAF domain-containing sensor histidine kinase [Thermoanaerobaculia bacterium]|nr:GAF domain-containing sensor histidine kinase [Thermoanaerobaculia bacterium]